MNVNRSPTGCFAMNQATRAVLVIWVVFNNHTVGDRFSQFRHADASDDGLINRMLRKLECIDSNLFPYLVNHGPAELTISPPPRIPATCRAA